MDAPIAWYGKLPARGDFVVRGLPPRWRRDWDGWLQRGMALAAANLGSAWLRERLGGFLPWRYVALTAPDERWCGIVAASHDRVGRAFPLTLVQRIEPGCSVQACAERLSLLLEAAAQGPEALDAAIATAPAMPPASSGWAREDPAAGADTGLGAAWPPAPASLWWPLEAAPHDAPIVTAWPPDPSLLLDLLDRQPAPHHSASAE